MLDSISNMKSNIRTTQYINACYIAFLLLSSSCSQKPIIPAYSKVIEEAKSRGVTVPSPEEERENFFKADKEHNERLIKIIAQRATEQTTDKEYKLGPGDEITLSVFDVPELNLTLQIKEDGSLTLPLIGIIKAAGLTEEHLLKEVRSKLSGYVINPQVTLFVSTYGSQKVAVIGAVKTPGSYALKKGSNSVLELIGEAGGLSEKAGSTLSFVPSESSGISAVNDAEGRARLALSMDGGKLSQKSGIDIYLDNVMGTSGNIPVEIPVRGGDMLIIPEAGKIMVDGEVTKVGVYELGRQATLLGALAAAGGITYAAKVDEVEIIREVSPDRRHRLVIDLSRISSGEERDYKLRNGDIVKVPSDAGRRMRQDTFEGISKLINFGVGGSVNMGP